MATYQLISSKSIIAKTKRDIGIERNDWVGDAIEWIGEALDAVGSAGQLVDKAYIVKTHSHRAALPKDLYYIQSVYFGTNNTDKTDKPKLRDFPFQMPYGDHTGHPAYVEEDTEHPDGASKTERETFIINGGYINTSFESDWIIIYYKAFPVDEDGFPLVPDSYSFAQCCYWYIVMKLMEGGMRHPQPQITWGVAEQRYLKYVDQARADANMPDISQMSSFRDMWVRLVPEYGRDFRAISDEPIDSDNLVADTFKRYTYET